MDLLALLPEAAASPAGSKPELVSPALVAYFDNKLPRDLTKSPEDADTLFRHLAGQTWAGELVKLGHMAMAHDRILALGFRDAAWPDVEAFIARNSIPTGRILHARLGRDPAEILVALSEKATSKRVKNAALAAAIAVKSDVVTPQFDLLEIGWAPLQRAALQALGPEGASEVVLRTLRTFDDQPEFRFQALAPVLVSFGPPLTAAAVAAIVERVELIRGEKHELMGWEGVGEQLARSEQWEPGLAFLLRCAGRQPGWRLATRAFLSTAVASGFPIDPALDEFIDPASAARGTSDVWKLTNRLLTAVGTERASKLLLDAHLDQPRDLLRFVVKNLSPAALARFAEVHVSLRDDPDAKDALIATRLQDLGPAFGDALQVALADVKPKQGYLKALQRNLEPTAWAALDAWLQRRPAPKKKKNAVKKA